ncbi:MAG: choice-of-anchor Q domain-containing protein, partial [Chloroflexota bacterium]
RGVSLPPGVPADWWAAVQRDIVQSPDPRGLSTTPDWTAEGDQEYAYFAYSVATAGDVNGDGYDDVIVGAHGYGNGQYYEGRAFVYYGSVAGLSLVANWTAESDQQAAYFGVSVATAGDVNGDGYDDVIVGAYGYNNGQNDEGRAFVYHGSAAGLGVTANWTAESNQAGALFGYSVASAGDINDDGYDDVIVGAIYYNNGQPHEGRAYVYQGSATGLSLTANWTAESNQYGSEYSCTCFGRSVATAGDVDGDGYDEVIVGAYGYDNGQIDEGRVFVYHGSATGLNPTANWTAESDQVSAYFGISVGTAGDVNGDGFDDVIVGASGYDNGQTGEGRAYVYHGSTTGLSVSANWTAESDQASAAFGDSVATSGDINGDGYGDVIVGSLTYGNGQAGEGGAFVYHGSASGLSTSSNWTVESDQAEAYFGNSVATAGDVNGDGYGDVIVGADRYDNGQADEGQAFVYHGSAASATFTVNSTIDAVDANPGDGICATAAGECTLRAAVQEANALAGADAITLPAGVIELTIEGTGEDAAATGDLDLTDDVSLTGAGLAQTLIRWSSSVARDRVLHIPGPATVTVAGVSIGGGRADNGGGIYNAGTLILVHSRLRQNRSGYGGGVYNLGTLTLDHSRLTTNTAGSGDGGGIHNGGTVTISNSTLSGNSAEYSGGGIFNLSTLTVSNVILAGNTADHSGGGGIYNIGTVTISNSTLSSNSAFTASGGLGGGIYNGGTVTISNSTLSGNSGASGGGIYNDDGMLTITNSTLSGNSADDGGGILNIWGTATVSHSTLSGNSATGYYGDGGGIYISYGGTLTVSYSTLSGNSAEYRGGGIINYGTLTVSNSTLSGNSAAEGGGIYRSSDSFTVSLQNTILADNADSNAGPDCSGTLTSDGYNLLGNNSDCTFNATTGDQVGTPDNPIDPLLGPLQDNGGPTWTHALLPGSPAIDAGNPAGCFDNQGNLLTTDQRGYARPVDGDGNGSVICDTGAYEKE